MYLMLIVPTAYAWLFKKDLCCDWSEPHRVNPARSARIDTCSFADASLDSVVETKPDLVEDDSKYASQVHVLQVLELMGCTDEQEHSVRRLPHIDIRYTNYTMQMISTLIV